MNRGFSYYFKKSSDLVSFVFGKQKFKDKFELFIYIVASMIGKLFFLTRPIFLVADQNLANMIVNGHSYSILKAFEGVKERYGKIFLAELVEGSLFFALLLIIVTPCALLLLNIYDTSLGFILLIAGAVAWLITCFILSYNYKFLDYVAAKNKSLDFSDYLYNSRVSVRGLKGTLFANDLVSFLLSDFMFVLLVGLAFLIGMVFVNILAGILGTYETPKIICAILILLVAVATALLSFFAFLPIKVRKIVTVYLIAEENCKTSRSIVVKRRPSNKVEYDALFDEPVKDEAIDLNK